MKSHQFRNSVVISLLLLSAFTQQVHAYLDPGSGSYLIQIIIASLVGAGFFFKSFWYRITQFFTKSPKDTPSPKDNEE
jgi:hypothetical protein